MLNKDQYNQDEYNNYYKQESEGAELKAIDEEGGKGKLFIFLALAGLGALGYFGYKILGSQDATNTQTVSKEKLAVVEKTKSEIQPIETPIETQKNIEQTIQKEVASQVQASMKNAQTMTETEMSKIAAMIIAKMEKEKPSDTKEDNNAELMNALKISEADTVEVKKSTPAAVLTEATTIAVAKEVEKPNTYNKVTVKESKTDEELTELSEQIKKLLNMAGANDAPQKKILSTTKSVVAVETQTNKEIKTLENYTKSLQPEIETRSNEMRIIIVKSGDTLGKIAKRAYGDSLSFQKIFDANPKIINQADKIYVGQKLRIPK